MNIKIILLTLFVSQSALAGVPIKVGLVSGQEPHIYLEYGLLQGAEGRLLDQALRGAGFDPTYDMFPSLRAIERLKHGHIHAAVNIKEESVPFAYVSSFSYEFQNCAATRREQNLRITGVADLANKDVVAFKNAQSSLSADRAAEIVKHAKSYREIQDVGMRIKLLKSGRAQVMLTEKEVFLYYLKVQHLGNPQDYTLSCFFKPNRYRLVFLQEDHRDQFNKAYQSVRK